MGTVAIDLTNMADGDVTSWIGVIRNGTSYTVQVRVNATQDGSTWATTSTGTVAATAPITGYRVWLRVSLDARASGTKLAQFYYSAEALASLSSVHRLSCLRAGRSSWAIGLGYSISRRWL